MVQTGGTANIWTKFCSFSALLVVKSLDHKYDSIDGRLWLDVSCAFCLQLCFYYGKLIIKILPIKPSKHPINWLNCRIHGQD
ncbi:hypothetical protein GDO81_007260 [Engystomops pustulosus]|uniref:Uncharacterized protein n=1 Tax=Engystomops pustulosus TaxID=76066 RepID=A0AAV7C5T2_ENGPU|nr:hypothetical protein GDO81_007260 [Engystomops pustulosus]